MSIVNLFHTTGLFPYPLKSSEKLNQMFSDVSRGGGKGGGGVQKGISGVKCVKRVLKCVWNVLTTEERIR